MITWKCRELISSLICVAIGMAFCINSAKYGDVRAGIPNPGLFPALFGMIFIFTSLINLLSSIRTKNYKKIEKVFPQADSPKKMAILIFALYAYGILLLYFGFVLTNFLFMVVLLKFIEPQKLVTTLIASFLVTVAAFIGFEVLLKVQLPTGIFESFKIIEWFRKFG
jgi:hypothetical protein